MSDHAIRAVLFDWRGTLVVAPSLDTCVRDGLHRSGKDVDHATVSALVARVLDSNGPVDRLDTPGMDADQDLHREIFMDVMRDADIATDLADAIYSCESDWRSNPFAHDSTRVIQSLADAGVAVAIVSDIHFDIRPAFESIGVGSAIGAYSLSYERGVQKPDPAMFGHALDTLGVEASEAVFVGDRAGPDGGAVGYGLVTLLLPTLSSPQQERLELVSRLVFGSQH